jgi:predicted small secreted protein
MTRTMQRTVRLVATIVLVIACSFALAACRKDSGSGGGGYMPAPGSHAPVTGA